MTRQLQPPTRGCVAAEAEANTAPKRAKTTNLAMNIACLRDRFMELGRKVAALRSTINGVGNEVRFYERLADSSGTAQ